MNDRIPTPRLHQPNIPVPVMTPSQTPAAANSYLLSAALSPYAAAQQLLLARAAVAADRNGAVPNPNPPSAAATPAQLFLSQTGAAALPYSYLMTAGFSPFCLPLNDATLAAAAAAAAAAASGTQNPAAMAAAIANAGLLVPQSALASAAAAQLLCQQAGGSGIRIQGSTTATPPAGCNESVAIQKANEEAVRRVSAPDIKSLQRQHRVDAEALIQHQQHQGNNQGGMSPGNSAANAALNASVVASLSREAVSEHIRRLISENEAIVEPPPALLKRRSYTKCHQGSASLDISALSGTASTSNACASGVRPPLGRSNRSQSLIDPPSIAAAAAAQNQERQLHQQALNNAVTASHLQVFKGGLASPSSTLSPLVADSNLKLNSCQFCNISFRNTASLRAHEFRCAHRVESIPESPAPMMDVSPTNGVASNSSSTPNEQKTGSGICNAAVSRSVVSREGCGENKHPLKKRILAAAELDAQKFGSPPLTGVTMQSPDTMKLIVTAAHEPGPQTTFTAGDSSPSTLSSLVPSSASSSHRATDLSALKNGRLRTTATATATATAAAATEMKTPMVCAMHQFQHQQQPATANSKPSCIPKGVTTASASAPAPVVSHFSVLPKINLSLAEQAGRFEPYRMTLKVHQEGAMAGGNPMCPVLSPRRPERVKPQQLTQITNCCQRKWPIVFCTMVPTESKESAFSVWPQVSVSPLDAKLNVMMMGGCNVRARWSAVKYATAVTSMSNMLVTESSYWEHSKRLQRLAAAAVVASTSGNVQQSTPEKATKETTNSNIEDEPERTSEQVVESKKTIERNVSEDEKDMDTSCGLEEEKTVKVVSGKSSRQRLKDILTSCGSNGSNGHPRKVVVCNGGYKTNEAYIYVRGRGRGRYVCERCGIRCKKPSMLKKHIRTHLNVRPYTCFQCMFSFKTKGNLTKHMKSQAHSKKLATLTRTRGSDGTMLTENKSFLGEKLNRLDNDSEYDTEEHDEADGYSTEDDFEENSHCLFRNGEYSTAELRRRRYSYKNIWTNVKDGCYPQRSIRTPPPSPAGTNQVCLNYTELFDRCDTAPPALNNEPSLSPCCDEDEIADNPESRCATEELEEDKFGEDVEMTNSLNSSVLAPAVLSDTRNRPQQLQPSSTLEPFFLNEGKCQCEICGKNFPKIGLLRLHMNVHYFEQTGRRYEYKCTFCNSSFRSRSLLQKHMGTAHQKQIQQQKQPTVVEKMEAQVIGDKQSDNQRKSISSDDQAENGIAVTNSTNSTWVESNEKTTSNGNSSNSANNPRPFECADCKIAFRIHGHLSKHLRSKSHINKLENMGRLPIGLYARLEEAGAQYIAEIDTSDCANSLKSLLSLADQFNMPLDDDEPRALTIEETPSTGSATEPQQTISLACTEEMLPNSPAPPPQVSVVTGSSCSTTENPATAKLQSESKSSTNLEPKLINGLTSRALILTADVWVPPTANDPVKKTDKPPAQPAIIATPSKTGSNSDIYNSDRTHGSATCSRPDNGKEMETTIRTNSTSPSATSQPSLCRLCNLNFPSALELGIHLHADHVVMRDGNDFRCPHANCDSVYPNRESLRHHVALHFYGRLDEIRGAMDTGAETPNGCDVSKSTVAALSRKLSGGNGTQSGMNSDRIEQQQEKSRKKTMKTHLVKLSSIPESNGNSNPELATASGSSCSSRSAVGGGGCGSTDASPISACGAIDSDASRASINGSHSTSPLTIADSPAGMDGFGRPSSGRQSAKRKSLDDLQGNTMVKRMASASSADHQQLLQFQALQQQVASFSSTPPTLNGLYQRFPTPSLLQTQSPVVFQQPNSNLVSAAAGWSARQQISPPQPVYFSASAAGGAQMGILNLQHPFASVALAQQNAAKLLAAGGVHSFWNTPAALAASQLFNASVSAPESAAALTGLNDAATAAAFGLLVPQSCILCGKQYANNAQLQEHLLSHSLARPYVCEHCDAGFTTEQALQSHRPCRQQRNDV